MVARFQNRGPKEGECNICTKHGLLTADHIPPRSIQSVSQVEMMSIISFLGSGDTKKGKLLSQDGVKFKTICTQCNNNLLGGRLDLSLISLANSVRGRLLSNVYSPVGHSFCVEINKLTRCVAGHVLAYGVDRGSDKSIYTQAMREYVLDESLLPPAGFSLFIWPFPYKETVIIRDGGITLDYFNSFATIWLVKFFPLAFMLVGDVPESWRLPYIDLFPLCTDDINYKSDLILDFDKIPDRRWPEAPGKTGMVLYGQDAMGAISRRLKSSH